MRSKTPERREYDRAYYAAYTPAKKALVLEQKYARRRAVAARLREYKATLSCPCGETHPACLDFHHTDDNKEVTVSVAGQRGWRFDRIMTEIRKCIVLCANCHRKLHFSEREAARGL